MSGLLFLMAVGLLLAQALPDDSPTTSSSLQPLSSTEDLTTVQSIRASPPTEKMSSLPDATSPGTTWSEEATEGPSSTSSAKPESSTSPEMPANSTSTSSDSKETSATPAEPPEHSSLAAQKPDERNMSSGVVALAMAFVFALLVVIVYAGLLLWRRYLEYRYGNRELLVNDLEFDTSDLRHFEL